MDKDSILRPENIESYLMGLNVVAALLLSDESNQGGEDDEECQEED